MRVFGGLRAFYYLQILLTGDNGTGRNPARFHTRGPLPLINHEHYDTNSKYTFHLTNFDKWMPN